MAAEDKTLMVVVTNFHLFHYSSIIDIFLYFSLPYAQLIFRTNLFIMFQKHMQEFR